jgi:tRNA(fMet)-specific endonuclease VapC
VSVRFLLDTNVLSEPARPAPHLQILARLEEHRREIATAAPVWNELLFGWERLPASRRKDRLERYLMGIVAASLPILAYDQTAAVWHAAERARLQASGKTPPYIDGQIAAIAKTSDLVLVTANGSDFAGFQGLMIEDWSR